MPDNSPGDDGRVWNAAGEDAEGGISGEDYAALKNRIHRAMGVGNWDPAEDPRPAPRRRSVLARLLSRFRRF